MPYHNEMGCPSYLRGWRLNAHLISGGGAIPTVPKKVEVACPFHSRKYCGAPSSLKKGCHQMLYNLIVYISAPCTLQHNAL